MSYNASQKVILADSKFRLAADQRHALGQDNLDKVEARMSPEQIAEAQRLAREWKPIGQR